MFPYYLTAATIVCRSSLMHSHLMKPLRELARTLEFEVISPLDGDLVPLRLSIFRIRDDSNSLRFHLCCRVREEDASSDVLCDDARELITDFGPESGVLDIEAAEERGLAIVLEWLKRRLPG